jgi:hypothetical protein
VKGEKALSPCRESEDVGYTREEKENKHMCYKEEPLPSYGLYEQGRAEDN